MVLISILRRESECDPVLELHLVLPSVGAEADDPGGVVESGAWPPRHDGLVNLTNSDLNIYSLSVTLYHLIGKCWQLLGFG